MSTADKGIIHKFVVLSTLKAFFINLFSIVIYEILERIIIHKFFNIASKKFGKVCHTVFYKKMKKDRKKACNKIKILL